MKVTREQVLEKAKEFGLTLSDAEVDQLVKDEKLPEKPATRDPKKELVEKHNIEQLAEIVIETRSEAKERRHENAELKKNVETLQTQLRELQGVKDDKAKTDAKLQEMSDTLKSIKDAEKKRRETIINKVDEKKRPALGYLTNVDAVTADQFDQTMDVITGGKTNGHHGAPPPGGDEEPVLTPAEQAEAKRLGLKPKAFLDVKKKREARKPAAVATK